VEGYMDLDIPSIMNYNIASCTTQIVNLDENAELQTAINDTLFIHNCDM
jgi:hypothetical protein